jgi:hypothetical protein
VRSSEAVEAHTAADCDWPQAGGDDDYGAAFYEDLPFTCEDAPHPATSASAAPGGRSEGAAGWAAAAGRAAATAMDLTFSPPEAGPDQRPGWDHDSVPVPYDRETGNGGPYHNNKLMDIRGDSDHTGNTLQARSPAGLAAASRPEQYQMDRAGPVGANHDGRRDNNDNGSGFGGHDRHEADAAEGGRCSSWDQQAPMDYDRDLDLGAMLVEEEEGLPAGGAAGLTVVEEEVGPVREEHTPATAPLQYWDQLSPPWSSGSSGGPVSSAVPDAAGSFIRMRGVTRRIERFSTVETDGAAQFDVTVLVDDGHNEVRCAVSNHLVERFLDLTAADFLVMQEQLGPDKAARRAARDGLVQRFMHLHGLFWAYPRQKEEIAAAAQLRAASSSSSSSHQGKRGRKGDTAGRGQEVQGEAVVLIDFADEDLHALCREMLVRRSLRT